MSTMLVCDATHLEQVFINHAQALFASESDTLLLFRFRGSDVTASNRKLEALSQKHSQHHHNNREYDLSEMV